MSAPALERERDTHEVVRVVVSGLNTDVHLVLTPPCLLCGLSESLGLKLTLLVEVVLRPRVHKDMQRPLRDFRSAQQVCRIVRQPFDWGARAGLIVEVI